MMAKLIQHTHYKTVLTDITGSRKALDRTGTSRWWTSAISERCGCQNPWMWGALTLARQWFVFMRTGCHTEEELEPRSKRTLDIPKEKEKWGKLSGPQQQLQLTLNHPYGSILPGAIAIAAFHGHHNCGWKFLSLTGAKKLLSLH